MSRKSRSSITHTKPANLDRQDVLRAIRYEVAKSGIRGTARKAGVPESTLRGWLKGNRVPPRSLDRGRGVVERIRQPISIPVPPKLNQVDQRVVLHWIFAMGPDASGIKLPAAQTGAALITTGKDVQRPIGDLDKVRDRAWQIAESHDYTGAVVSGGEFQDEYRDKSTAEGRQFLSDAFISGLQYLLDQAGKTFTWSTEVPDGAGSRARGTVTTLEAFKVWDIYDYCLPLPDGLFAIVYQPWRLDGVYELTVWEITPGTS